jgi:phytoene dehydrogenase-like protein
LLQNKTYLYHVVGNKTGEWRVPVGGMGAVVETLTAKASQLGVTMLTDAEVTKLSLGEPNHSVCFEQNNQKCTVSSEFVLVNAAPKVLYKLLNEPLETTVEDEGCVFKVNMLLKRLPKLKAQGVRSEDAFAGTFHINQGYEQMAVSYQEALSGKIPTLPPCEIYCHTLTDNSILSPEIAAAGYHTLTLFGLDVPHRLFIDNNEGTKKQLLDLYLKGINDYLSESIEDCIARAADGSLCIEAKSPVDLEAEVGLPTGNIFHNALSWFYADNETDTGTWGVETNHARLYVCGSGAKRGGAVSGITGHNAAMKVVSKIQ